MAEHHDFDRFYQSKWEQLKNATRLAAEHRRRVKEGDLSVFLIPLVLSMAKDGIFDFLSSIPIAGLVISFVFSFPITVYLFIFMWGRGRMWLRFIFFIIAVLDLIPFINLIPFNTASVIFALHLARRDASKAKADLEKVNQALPKIAQGLKGAAIQRDRMMRAAAAAQADEAAVQEQSQGNAAEEARDRTNPVQLAREVQGLHNRAQERAVQNPPHRSDGAPATGIQATNDTPMNPRSTDSLSPSTMNGVRTQPVSSMPGRPTGNPESKAGQPLRQPMVNQNVPSVGRNTSYQTVTNQSGDAMTRIKAVGSRLVQPASRAAGMAPRPLVVAPQVPLPSQAPLSLSRPEQSKVVAVDPILFGQEARAYIDAVYGHKPNDIPALKKIHTDFFQPYQSGRRSLSGLLRDKETAPQALEILRKANISYRYEVDNTTWKKRALDPHSFPEFLSREVTASLDALDSQLERSDLSKDEMRQLRNNAFYVVAEALDTASVDNRKKIDAWLAKHEEDIKALDTFTSDDGKIEDALALFTKQTIIASTENEDMARRHLEALFAGPLTTESGWKLDEIRREIIDPILERFDPQDQFLARRQALVAEVETASFGLNKKIVEKWRQAKVWFKKDEQGNDMYRESYSTNLWGVRNLEAVRPGAAAVLSNEFGIANFGRYDKKMLLRQFEMKDKDVRYGVVVYPEADWNGAFSHNTEQLAEASEQLREGGVETIIVEAASQRDLARRLLALHRKNSTNRKKFAFAIVAGHGSEGSVAFGQTKSVASGPPPLPDALKTDKEFVSAYDQWLKSLPNQDKGDFTKDDILKGKGIGRAFNEWFEDGAPKVLISCSTGAEGGIAQQVSEKSSGQISAPKIPTNIEKINVTFGEDGKFAFDVKYYGTETAQYAAGKKVMS